MEGFNKLVEDAWNEAPVDESNAMSNMMKEIEIISKEDSTIGLKVELELEVSKDEVKRAVWDCGTDKAPGPDGFTFGFYRRFWKVIENDVFDAVNHFFTYGDIPKVSSSQGLIKQGDPLSSFLFPFNNGKFAIIVFKECVDDSTIVRIDFINTLVQSPMSVLRVLESIVVVIFLMVMDPNSKRIRIGLNGKSVDWFPKRKVALVVSSLRIHREDGKVVRKQVKFAFTVGYWMEIVMKSVVLKNQGYSIFLTVANETEETGGIKQKKNCLFWEDICGGVLSSYRSLKIYFLRINALRTCKFCEGLASKLTLSSLDFSFFVENPVGVGMNFRSSRVTMLYWFCVQDVNLVPVSDR
ncbi:hypothetical protein Tco_0324464 [Tanacetum coccineum]